MPLRDLAHLYFAGHNQFSAGQAISARREPDYFSYPQADTGQIVDVEGVLFGTAVAWTGTGNQVNQALAADGSNFAGVVLRDDLHNPSANGATRGNLIACATTGNLAVLVDSSVNRLDRVSVRREPDSEFNGFFSAQTGADYVGINAVFVTGMANLSLRGFPDKVGLAILRFND